jgi:hypothetical protein
MCFTIMGWYINLLKLAQSCVCLTFVYRVGSIRKGRDGIWLVIGSVRNLI